MTGRKQDGGAKQSMDTQCWVSCRNNGATNDVFFFFFISFCRISFSFELSYDSEITLVCLLIYQVGIGGWVT